jgi:DNA-binding CsgD family transcriptional regulator
MKQSNAQAYLRQLCCSGLSKDIVISEFLHAVKTVIPSDNNVFFGCGEQFYPAYYITAFDVGDLAERIPVVISGFATPERQRPFAEWFSQHPVLTDPNVWDKSFHRSDLYNLVWRQFDQHHVLWAPVRQSGKPVGMLSLYRSRQHKPFNSCEQALALRLVPYVAHALQMPEVEITHYNVDGTTGMMIMDTQGSILYLSREAKRLLALACLPTLTLDARCQEDSLLARLRQLCRNLDAIFRGHNAAPPSWCHHGPHGRFLFRAYWLNQQNNEAGGLIGMTIEHQEPMLLKILRPLQNLPLSPTQKEVAVLLAQDVSSVSIGERLHIKPTTVKDHIGKIFIKLDIHHREELLPKLLELEKAIDVRSAMGLIGRLHKLINA